MKEINRRFGSPDSVFKDNEIHYLVKSLSNKSEKLPISHMPELKKLLLNVERFMVHGNYLQTRAQISPVLTLELSLVANVLTGLCRYNYIIGKPLATLI